MEIIKMSDDTWRIEDEGVRFFLLSGKEKALLIDSGRQIHNARELAGQLVSLPVELLNTHADLDHIGSNDEFEVFYMHPSEASNYYNTQKKTGRFIPVEQGDILDLGGRRLEIIAIPGHTPGSIAVLDLENRVLYSGDTVQDGRIFMFGVQRELHAYIQSLEKLDGLRDRFDLVYPSHGTIPVKPELISRLRQAALSLLDGRIAARDVEFHQKALKLYDAGCASFLMQSQDGQTETP